MDVDPDTDVRDLLRAQRLANQPQTQASEGKLSKRAEKKVRTERAVCIQALSAYVDGFNRKRNSPPSRQNARSKS